MYRDEDQGLTPEEIIPRDEMLLDVCLEEVLSGQAPPDLRAQILARLEQSPSQPVPTAEPPRVPAATPIAPPPVPPPVQPAHNQGAEQQVVPHVHSRQSRRLRVGASHIHARQDGMRQWLGMAVAASLLAVGLGVGVVAWQSANRNNVASREQGEIEASGESTTAGGNTPEEVQRHRRDHDQALELASKPFSEPLFGAGFPALPEEDRVPWSLPYTVEKQSTADVVQFVNQQVAHRSASSREGMLEDDQWCERVFQQILGRSPTSEELVDFATSGAADKRTQLVDTLLTRESYQEEYASHWADVWTNELLAVSDEDQREPLRAYLAEALRTGKPHDALTKELIAASSQSDDAANGNGAQAFVLAHLDEDKSKLAAQVSRVFLGHKGQCAQCHDNSDSRFGREHLTQQQFWQLAAFFQQTDARSDAGQRALIDRDFVGRSGDIDEAELYYDTLKKQRKIAYPVFIDGTPINPDGRIDVVNRRQELARLITQSEDFAKAAVDLYWSKMIGDSLLDEDAGYSDQQLAQGLAEQFAAHDFDQRALLRWIALNDANAMPVPDRDLSPLYDNALLALQDVSQQGRPVPRDATVLFARVAPPADGRVSDGAIFVPTKESDSSAIQDQLVRKLIRSEMSFAQKVQHVFLNALHRSPNREEMTAARQMLSAHDGDIAATLDDINWAITHSAEFD